MLDECLDIAIRDPRLPEQALFPHTMLTTDLRTGSGTTQY
jgi:hypothetical protein